MMDSRLAELTRRQHGVFTFGQAVPAMMTARALSRWAARGALRRVLPKVYATEDPGPDGMLMAACLWAGGEAVISHRAAGRVYRLAGCESAEPEISIDLGRCPRHPSIIVHRSPVPPEDRRVVRALPITSAARTLIDLASCLDEETLAMAVEDAWRRKLVPLGWLTRRAKEAGGRGKPGMVQLRAVTDDCWARGRPLDSALEVRVWRLIKRSGLPMPRPGYEVQDDEGQPMRLDFAYPAARLAIEADGRAVHGQIAYFDRDATRDSRLAAAGWYVQHVTWSQLKTPEKVIDRITQRLRA